MAIAEVDGHDRRKRRDHGCARHKALGYEHAPAEHLMISIEAVQPLGPTRSL
jgi:hypothetical protein